ncbi:MAG: class I SAM-dependent methyltransferase [Methylococcales bacterium]
MDKSAKPLEEIHTAERAKWDSLAPDDVNKSDILEEEASFQSVTNNSYLLQGIADYFGDLAGKKVLEYGCGLGKNTILLAKAGADVTTFDLSPKSVEYTKKRSEANGVSDRVEAHVAPAEDLPFPNNEFDIVFGQAILHHIDTAAGAPELFRVTKPGGKVAFTEPLGMNPLLNFVREYVPYPHKHTRGEDHPLKDQDINGWTAGYSDVRIIYIQLLSMLERGLGFGKKLPVLRKADTYLLERYPALRRYCRYAVFLMTK